MRTNLVSTPRVKAALPTLAVVLLILVIGYLDWVTPYEYSLELLYFVPLAVFALRAAWPWAAAMSVYAAATWFLADYFTAPSPMRGYSLQTLVWIAAIRIGTLCLFSYVVVRAKRALHDLQASREQLRQLNQELEQRVAARTAELCRSLDEMEHFSYAIVHDMRAPLRAMIGFSELAEQKSADGQTRLNQAFIRRVKIAARRMDQLITDSLNFSKAVRQELPLRPVELAAVLRDLVETYPNLQPEKADIQVQGSLPTVLGNEAGLIQCFGNLLDNSVKFARPGIKPKICIWADAGPTPKSRATTPRSSLPAEPPAEVGTAPAPNHALAPAAEFVRIWVADNGIGIPKEFQNRIFDMFQRGSNEQHGTGTGLAIVHKIVQRMGGHIGVESEPGTGSRFWLELIQVHQTVSAAVSSNASASTSPPHLPPSTAKLTRHPSTLAELFLSSSGEGSR